MVRGGLLVLFLLLCSSGLGFGDTDGWCVDGIGHLRTMHDEMALAELGMVRGGLSFVAW